MGIKSTKIVGVLVITTMVLSITLLSSKSSTIVIRDPKNPFFTIYNIETAPNSERSLYLEAVLMHIGIDLKVVPTTYNSIVSKILGPYPAPLYQDGGFDIITTFSIYNNDFGIWPCGCNNSQMQNFGLPALMYWANATAYNNLLNLIDATWNDNQRYDFMGQLLQFQNEFLPYIVLTKNQVGTMISNEMQLSQDQLDGILTNQIETGYFSQGWSTLHHPTKNKIRIGYTGTGNLIPLLYDIESTAIEFNFPNMVFQSLYQRDYADNNKYKPLLASGMPELLNDNKTIRVNLKENVTFADGQNMTAVDVVESFKTFLTKGPDASYWLKFGFNSTSDIRVVNTFTVDFDLKFATPNYMEFLKPSILPFHIFGNHTSSLSAWDYESLLVSGLLKGNNTYGFGTGPFMYKSLSDLIYHNVTLVANPNYWDGNVTTTEIDVVNYLNNIDSAIVDIKRDTTQILSSPLISKSRSPFNQTDLVSYFRERNSQWFLGFNPTHPIFGTGISTPLGKQDSERASEAAKYIRQAISYAIPRNRLLPYTTTNLDTNSSYFGSRNFEGFEEQIPYLYNMTRAKELMIKAGYEFPVETIESSSSFHVIHYSSSTIEQTSLLPIELILIPILLAKPVTKLRRST